MIPASHRGAPRPSDGQGSVFGVRRVLLSPSWWWRHLLAVGLVALFLRLGWWQFTKGESNGTLQNLFYGVEWPVFAAMVIWFWVQMILDEINPGRRESRDDDKDIPTEEVRDTAAARAGTATSGDSLGVTPAIPTIGTATSVSGSAPAVPEGAPALPVDEDEDEELAAYNRYLAALYERDHVASSRRRAIR